MARFSGSTSFTYYVTAGTRILLPATVSINVSPQQTAITVVDDTYVALADTSLMVAPAQGVLANDSGGAGALSAVLVSNVSAAAGSVALNPHGSFEFSPAEGFTGLTSLTYYATDGVQL